MCRALASTLSVSALLAAMLSAVGAGVAHADPVSTGSTGSARVCPASRTLSAFRTADNVTASFTNNANTSTYHFSSVTNENPRRGVPGLVSYCVYPTPTTLPTTVTPQATGADGSAWASVTGSDSFAFTRPRGNPSNIPLDGTSTQIGTATFSNAAPDTQAILLRINDPAVCRSLYGHHDDGDHDADDVDHGHHDGGAAEADVHSETDDNFFDHDALTTGGIGDLLHLLTHHRHHKRGCFVKPSTPCAHGARDANIAYTALPMDVLQCAAVPSLGFEATSTNEFGDEVGLRSGGGPLGSMQVLFQSFGCSVSGHWFSGDCQTTPGATFTHPITAKVYAVDNSGPVPQPGALLASVTQNFQINFRPSADNTRCTGADVGKWFNPSIGACANSFGQLLDFTFPSGTTLPSQVIWTVAFNTTHYGANPIGTSAPCFSSPAGCGYDSLYVGAKTFPGAPYVGTDVDPAGVFLNASNGSSYCDGGAGGTGALRLDRPCWAGYTPLGEIRYG